MLSVGTLIWISCRPLIRLIFCISCGFIITKADIFPTVAARGASQIVLNITIPCLLFSKIVPAFTADNLNALGPLVLVAILYEIIGVLLAWIIKLFFWVPHQFRYGILVAGGWGNVGDIPTSVIMSVTSAAPFQGATDQALSIAYVSTFILVFLVTLFPFGAHRWIAMDYVGPDVEPEEVRETMRLKHKALFRFFFRQKHKFNAEGNEKRNLDHQSIGTLDEKNIDSLKETNDVPHRRLAFIEDTTTVTPTERDLSLLEIGAQGRINSLEQTNTISAIDIPQVDNNSKTVPDLQTQLAIRNQSLPTFQHPSTHSLPLQDSRKKNLSTLRSMYNFLKTFFTPPSISIFISFPISLIPKLKALFTPVPGTFIPPAPDGQPPLAFILDATTFMGAASVPLGLICLGSALARLHLPKKGEWRTLPLGAIGSLAVGKMLVMPVLGVLICQGLTNVGIISKDDKVLRFVCIFMSCLPTATTQVFLTQVYGGTGTAQHLSVFLIPQYIIMLISMTALIAYTLQIIF